MTFTIPSNYSIPKTVLSILATINSVSGTLLRNIPPGLFPEFVDCPEGVPCNQYLAHCKHILKVAVFCRRYLDASAAAAASEQYAVTQQHQVYIGVTAFAYYIAA